MTEQEKFNAVELPCFTVNQCNKVGMTHVTRKQTLRSLLLSYQKKDGRTWLHPSFFWYDTDFLEFESFDFIDHIL